MLQNTKQDESNKNWRLLPLILTAFIPLIVYYHVFDTKLDQFSWFGTAKQADVFLYWKMAAIIAISVIMLIVLIVHFRKKIARREFIWKDNIIFVPLIIFGLLTFLSTIFSEYSYWGFNGISNQFESVWVVLGYLVIVFYAYWFIKAQKDMATIIKWLIISMGLVFLIGAFQAFSLDFYRSGFGKMTYLPGKLKDADITFNFEIGKTYTSLYNPNYVGVLVCLLLPLFIVLFLSAKGLKAKIAYAFVLLITLISLWGSGSKSGLLCIGASLLFLAVLFGNTLLKHWKISGACIIGLLLFAAAVNIITGNKIVSTIQTAFAFTAKEKPVLEEIQTNDDNLLFRYNGNTMVFTYNPSAAEISDQLMLSDDAGNPLESTLNEEQRVILSDPKFNGLSVALASYGDILCFDFLIDGTNFYFTNQTGDNSFYYITLTGKFDKIEKPEINQFWGDNANFASRRGFIWSRTIPLLKDNIFLGAGADSFTLAYPNNDYVGRYNYGFSSEIISKPHNLYLQMGVQTGVISVLAFIIFYLIYFISSIRLYLKTKLLSCEAKVGAAILAGTFGYMLMGLSNDSTITVAPIFWLLIGLGLAINRNVRMGNNK